MTQKFWALQIPTECLFLSFTDSGDEDENSESSNSSDPDDTTSKSTVVAVPMCSTMSPPIEALQEDEPVEIPELKSLFGLNSSHLTDQPLAE